MRSRRFSLGVTLAAIIALIEFAAGSFASAQHLQPSSGPQAKAGVGTPAAASAPQQTKFTTLLSFDETDGQYPDAPLLQGIDGNFYSTTDQGADGAGEVFKITSTGTLLTLHSFCSPTDCTDGTAPVAPLVQTANGMFYGTTAGGGAEGGANGSGTVFEITPWGALRTLYSFCAQPKCIDGASPVAGLVQAANQNLYGTTYYGGANNKGTVFEITPTGKLTTLYSFCAQANCADGSNPKAGLIQASDGNLYGTAYTGGGGFCGSGCGTVFKITPQGAFTVLHVFVEGSDGALPAASLIQATDGNLYGTTENGGLEQGGVVFKITSTGNVTTVYSFCANGVSCTDGYEPLGSLVQATDGNFYGTTVGGGDYTCDADFGCGTIFKVTPSGVLATLHTFKSGEGDFPVAGLVQGTDGKFYGTAQQGGAYVYNGSVFSLSVGLAPFVRTLDHLRRGGIARHHPRQQPDGHDRRLLQRYCSKFRRRLGHRNRGHRPHRRDHRPRFRNYLNRHPEEQR